MLHIVINKMNKSLVLVRVFHHVVSSVLDISLFLIVFLYYRKLK